MTPRQRDVLEEALDALGVDGVVSDFEVVGRPDMRSPQWLVVFRSHALGADVQADDRGRYEIDFH